MVQRLGAPLAWPQVLAWAHLAVRRPPSLGPMSVSICHCWGVWRFCAKLRADADDPSRFPPSPHTKGIQRLSSLLETILSPPVVPFYPSLGEGSPTKIDYRYLIPTSLDLGMQPPFPPFSGVGAPFTSGRARSSNGPRRSSASSRSTPSQRTRRPSPVAWASF